MSGSAPAPSGPEEEALPHDAATIGKLLEAMGVKEYEPRVVNQLVDFMYRYVADIVMDAEAYAPGNGGDANALTMDDVMAAAAARAEHHFVVPPPLETLTAMAASRNAAKLPSRNARHFGLLLPTDEELLLVRRNAHARSKEDRDDPAAGRVEGEGGAQPMDIR